MIMVVLVDLSMEADHQVGLLTEGDRLMEVDLRVGLSMTTAVMVTMGALTMTMIGDTQEALSILAVEAATGPMGTVGTIAMAIPILTGRATMRLQQASQTAFVSLCQPHFCSKTLFYRYWIKPKNL